MLFTNYVKVSLKEQKMTFLPHKNIV